MKRPIPLFLIFALAALALIGWAAQGFIVVAPTCGHWEAYRESRLVMSPGRQAVAKQWIDNLAEDDHAAGLAWRAYQMGTAEGMDTVASKIFFQDK